MGSHFGGPRRNRRTTDRLLAAALLLTLADPRPVVGQAQTPSQYPQTIPPLASGREPLGQGPDSGADSMLRQAQAQAAKKRSAERQNKLLADSNKIVQLALELGGELQAAPATLSPEARIKKAQEIEKLARSVKERMKSE